MSVAMDVSMLRMDIFRKGSPMICLRILLCFIALLATIYGCAKRDIPGDRSDEERKVRELEIAVSKAFDAKDPGKLVSLYDDDAALYDDRDPSIRGKDAIREAWSAAFAKPGITMSTEPQTVEISNDGDLVWAHGTFVTETNNAAGKPVFDH
jgi:ketosteroid isomerase-like protein